MGTTDVSNPRGVQEGRTSYWSGPSQLTNYLTCRNKGRQGLHHHLILLLLFSDTHNFPKPAAMSSHTDPSRASQLPPAPTSKTQRVLACVLCQQRKVKCDRRFPCANCTKHQLQCVPATQARRRRRRFPERDLLDRLRAYEDLLRQNNVKFEPLHGDPPVYQKESPEGDSESDVERSEHTGIDPSSATTPAKSESSYEPK